MAALAVVIMSLGTLIPVATYVCPMLCCLILQLVLRITDDVTAWAWFGVVSLLSLLMAPDKEAAAVFMGIGYYPIIKPKLDKRKGRLLWKLLLFNTSVLLTYWILIEIVGLDQIMREFSELGKMMTAILVFLGNVIFFLLDRLLSRQFGFRMRK